MKKIIALLAFVFLAYPLFAQENITHIATLEIGKKAKRVFQESSSDSTLFLHIDTLILRDKASLIFYGQKNVHITADYAIIGKDAIVSGTDGKNNGTHFDLNINIQKLGSLYVIAKGQDAFNGTKTFPNGNGGNVRISFPIQSIPTQRTDKKAAQYLFVSNQAGGKAVNASSELRNIYDRVKQAPAGLRGLPQGQIYSGSPGVDGKTEFITEK